MKQRLFIFINSDIFNQQEGINFKYIYLWLNKERVPVKPPMKYTYQVYGALFSIDELKILTWSRDCTARLWDAIDGQPMGLPMNHQERINVVLFDHLRQRVLRWAGNMVLL